MPSIARSNLVKLPSILLILSVTSACVHGSTDPVPVNSYCKMASPISYDSTKDTPETVKQIEQHNSKYICVCENDCPKP